MSQPFVNWMSPQESDPSINRGIKKYHQLVTFFGNAVTFNEHIPALSQNINQKQF